jgi:predicted nucleic acid-binding protein
VHTELLWLVLVAFLRVTTNPRVYSTSLSAEKAMRFVDDWLALPAITPVDPGPDHWRTLQRLLLRSGAAGNLTNDA